MKSARLTLLALLFLLFASPAGGQLEPVQPDPGTGCVECTRNSDNSAQCGQPVAWGEPSSWACVGGWKCYPVYGGWYCEPNCGNRCYSI